MENQDIFKILNQIFMDEKFLLETGTYNDSFLFQELMYKLNTILNYYIATRDKSLLSVEEIEEKYFWIKNKLPTQKILDNILINGYLTHSFPGV